MANATRSRQNNLKQVLIPCCPITKYQQLAADFYQQRKPNNIPFYLTCIRNPSLKRGVTTIHVDDIIRYGSGVGVGINKLVTIYIYVYTLH